MAVSVSRLTFLPLCRTKRKACILLSLIWDSAHWSFSSSYAPDLWERQCTCITNLLTHVRRQLEGSLGYHLLVSCIFRRPITLRLSDECQAGCLTGSSAAASSTFRTLSYGIAEGVQRRLHSKMMSLLSI